MKKIGVVTKEREPIRQAKNILAQGESMFRQKSERRGKKIPVIRIANSTAN